MLTSSVTWFLCALILAAIPCALPFSTLLPQLRPAKPTSTQHGWNFRPAHGGSTQLRRCPPVFCVADETASSASTPPPDFRPPGLRLIANEEETLAAGATALLPEHMSQHAVKVRKVRVGHGLRVFNARCGEWYAEVVTADAASVPPTLTERPNRRFSDLKFTLQTPQIWGV
ncbi:hypothetical protein T484DRAFT_3414479 [Baffinella frigidus]|nr:hypothetical protein T484DRAFT_3414479 [Cryptophyta sp. CCMP2293]